MRPRALVVVVAVALPRVVNRKVFRRPKGMAYRAVGRRVELGEVGRPPRPALLAAPPKTVTLVGPPLAQSRLLPPRLQQNAPRPPTVLEVA